MLPQHRPPCNPPQAERYEEMVEYMKEVAKGTADDLSLEVCQ